MKIALEVKNPSKILKPAKNDIIIFNGREWYVTTKADLFKEYDERFTDKLEECEAKIIEMDKFRLSVAKQMLDMQEILARLLEDMK